MKISEDLSTALSTYLEQILGTGAVSQPLHIPSHLHYVLLCQILLPTSNIISKYAHRVAKVSLSEAFLTRK